MPRLLDSVEDVSGAWVADSVLAALRSVASWYATRHDNYAPPFVKNMRRVPASARSRSRILDDDELRSVWKAAEASDDVYGAFVRVALLCGQRRAKLADLKFDDLDGDVWRIRRRAAREGCPGGVAAAASGHEGHQRAAARPRLALRLHGPWQRLRWAAFRGVMMPS